MITLESPIEAIALNYGVFTAVNLWPWIAVLTAAISFWKIKKSSLVVVVDDFVHVSRLLSRVDSRGNVSPLPPAAAPHCDPDLLSSIAATAAATTPSSPQTTENKVQVPLGDDATITIPSSPQTTENKVQVRLGDDATIKGKFALYFYNCNLDDDVDDEDLEEEEEEVVGELSGGGEIVGGWEAVSSTLTVKMGDLGWYRYQDLTVLNGKVVRLWDGELRRRNGAVVTPSSW